MAETIQRTGVYVQYGPHFTHFYTILALGVSFLCSILEAVVLSIPNTQVAVWQKEGNRRGEIWAKLKADDAVKPPYSNSDP